MSGFTLCFDLMEMIGKSVETKREQNTRDYWIDLGWARRPKPVIQTINEIGDELMGEPIWNDNAFALLGNILETRGEIWEEEEEGDEDYDWWDEPEFWESRGVHVTKAFMEGSYWRRVIWEDEEAIERHRLEEEHRQLKDKLYLAMCMLPQC
jgi:hypothetical protein